MSESIYQLVAETGEANDSYIVGAFARTQGIPRFTHKNYGASGSVLYGRVLLRVEFQRGTTTVTTVEKEFSTDTSDWQYLSFEAKANAAFTRIKVSLFYTRNLNTAYFDGISLYKDGYGTAYTYDSKNNLQKIVTKEGKTYLYEYYENNDLEKSTDEYGDITEYTYDAKHNVKTVTFTPKDSSISKITKYNYDKNGNVINTSSYDTRDTSKCFVSYTDYLNNNNYKTTDTDSRGNSVGYTYDLYGRLETVTDSKDTLRYTYDYRDKLKNVYSDETKDAVGYEYTDDNLSKIFLWDSVNGIRLQYKFNYNTFGQLTNTYVNSKLLITNTYDSYKQLSSTTYGNGYYRSYRYDGNDRLSEIRDAEYYVIADYKYTDGGSLSEIQDCELHLKTSYDYDDEGRLIREVSEPTISNEGTKASVIYTYDDRDRISVASNEIGDHRWTETYKYDDTDYRYDTLTTSDGVVAETYYDYLGREIARTTGDFNSVRMVYSYEDNAQANSATNLVSQFTATGQPTKSYTYDETGLITKISSDDENIQYTYDEKSQLISAYNVTDSREMIYRYDDSGNITSKSYCINEDNAFTTLWTKQYTYDSTWSDLLVSYDGQSISYDAIGNPTKYLEFDTLSWTGRNLDYIKDGNTFLSFYTYDIDGLRRTKRVGNTETEYIYTGGQLSALKVGNDMLYFTYDANGTLVSVKYNNDIYYYVINPQGDVVGLCNENGNPIATYTYDEWGYPLSAPTSGIGALNPFRYRGYIYDEETGFYYLQSRYYDPEVGRFINADDTAVLTVSPMAISEKNLFAYCDNNPVMRIDHNGQIWFAAMAIGAVAGAIISASVSAVTQYLETGDINAKVVAVNAITGAVSGALATTGIGLGASVAVSSGLNTVNYIGEQVVTGQEISVAGLGISAVSGALGGLVAGKGMNAEGLRSTWNTMQKGVNRWAQKAASKLAVKRMAFYSAEKTIIKKTVAVAAGRFIASVVSNPISSKKMNMLYKRLG